MSDVKRRGMLHGITKHTCRTEQEQPLFPVHSEQKQLLFVVHSKQKQRGHNACSTGSLLIQNTCCRRSLLTNRRQKCTMLWCKSRGVCPLGALLARRILYKSLCESAWTEAVCKEHYITWCKAENLSTRRSGGLCTDFSNIMRMPTTTLEVLSVSS